MSLPLHNALGQVLLEVGAEPGNEVIILTGTGDVWTSGLDARSFEHMALQELAGLKRSAFALLAGEPVDAQQALDIGLINEVLPAGELPPRTRQLAETITSQPRCTRPMTHAILQRPGKRRLVHGLAFGRSHQLFNP
jgi:enoyl-CoA hydratase/carnithine racemase